MDLFIANLTKQNFELHYWLPEGNRALVQKIPAGGQSKIGAGKSLTSDDIDCIIRQHQPYGLIDVKDIDRAKTFVGTCYSIGKPVNVDAILNGFELNDEELLKAAHERRKESALAANAIASEIANSTDSTIESMEVRVQQEKSNQFDTTETIDQTIEVEGRRRGRPRRS